ncbi:MAG: hydrogenase maturation protease [Coprothermobacterota bacterium]|nr:hydrogenase maturation protease [Coprothermobacterota bacterium]
MLRRTDEKVASLRVVLGLGNLLLSDDGLGVHAVRALEGRFPGWELIDGGTKGLFLLPYLQGADGLLIIDAIRWGREPGTIHLFDARVGAGLKPAPTQHQAALSSHDLGLLELLRALRLQASMPRWTWVVGLEPASLDWGTALSPKLEEALPGLLETICSLAGTLQDVDMLPQAVLSPNSSTPIIENHSQ